jgi:hypothetical protein
VPARACAGVAFECSDARLDLAWVSGSNELSGPKAAFAGGDLVLSNARVKAVFDALDTPHALAPSGGSLIDLVPAAGADDGLNQVFQAVGILPDDAAHYTSVDVLDARPDGISLVYRGRLDLRPDFSVVTRYELRACEPGLRVRTELHHGGRDPLTVFLSDAWFWGDRGALPFTPGAGLGFRHPEVELETLGDAFVDAPFLTAASPGTASAAYATVPCDRDAFSGFHSSTISATGAPRSILMPGDALAFERFVGVAPGPGHARAIEIATDVRVELHGDSYSELTGRVIDELGRPVDGREERAAVLVERASESGNVVAEAAPEPDGSFRVRVLRGESYRVRVSLFGRMSERETSVTAAGATATASDLVVPAWSELTVNVNDRAGAALISEVVLVPVDPEQAARYQGSIFGEFAEDECAPLLGPPHGASPACNRVLLGPDGTASFEAPPGEFWVYATHGPFWSLARERVALEPGEPRTLAFTLEPLGGLLPEGALSADLHVHGAASFDSSLPDRDRALSFVASDVNVIVASDHDVVSDYAKAVRDLGIAEKVHVMPGVETTGQILYYRPPESDVPKVIGHFNFWPLRHDALAPRHGAPDDERVEPGALFERMRELYDGTGVAQLNHPFAEAPFGRDNGYFTAVGYDPRRAIPPRPDGTPEGELSRRAPGGTSNLDFDVQEVMNGASVEGFFGYRAAWFSLLNQGFLRAGTANSDSHTLAIELLGYPRTIVLGQGTLADFDRERFNRAVRAGNSFGTNGPVLSACARQGESACLSPSLGALAGDATLELHVSAAPWIPVDEARLYVNGRLARVLPAESAPPDPLGNEGLVRLEAEVSLFELASAAGAERDFWVVVEAGLALPTGFDLDDDGLIDSTGYEIDGTLALPTFAEPGRVPGDDPRFHVQSIAPGVLPLAFTNPFVVDRDGDGWQAPGLP